MLLNLLTISAFSLAGQAAILITYLYQALNRKKRFFSYGIQTKEISDKISDYEEKHEEEPWRRAEIEIAFHDFGHCLARGEEDYLKLFGYFLKRFVSSFTPEREYVLEKEKFIIQLKENTLELGLYLSQRNKSNAIKKMIEFYDLTCRYPKLGKNPVLSSKLRSDLNKSLNYLRNNEVDSIYKAKKVLTDWKYSKLMDTDPLLILIQTNTRYVIEELGLHSSEVKRRLTEEIQRSIDYCEEDKVKSFDSQSNALRIVTSSKQLWEPAYA